MRHQRRALDPSENLEKSSSPGENTYKVVGHSENLRKSSDPEKMCWRTYAPCENLRKFLGPSDLLGNALGLGEPGQIFKSSENTGKALDTRKTCEFLRSQREPIGTFRPYREPVEESFRPHWEHGEGLQTQWKPVEVHIDTCENLWKVLEPSDTLGNTIGSDENLHKALRVSKNMGKSLDLSENLRRL